MNRDTFRYLEFRGPDYNSSTFADWELEVNGQKVNGQEFGINAANDSRGLHSDWVLDHVVIWGYRNNGVHANSPNGTVQHSVIKKNARTGIAFYCDYNNYNYAINNLITNNGNDGIDNNGPATITGNTVTNNGYGYDSFGGDQTGILIYACTGGIVANNVTRNNNQHGIQVSSCTGGGSGTWSIKQNTIGGNGRYGIELLAPINDLVTIDGDNICETGNAYGCFRAGVANVSYPTPPSPSNYSASSTYSGTSISQMFDGLLTTGWSAGDHEGWVAFKFAAKSFNKVRIYTGSNNSKYQTFSVEAYRNGVMKDSSQYQQRLVTSYAQGGGWIELSIAADTYDSLVVRQWGWRYPTYTYYWDDPDGGGWVGVNELWLVNASAPAFPCATPVSWGNVSSSGTYPGTSYADMFDGNPSTGWSAGYQEGWVSFSFQPKRMHTVKIWTGSNVLKLQSFAVEAYSGGSLKYSTGPQEKWVQSYSQGGGWVEMPIAPGTYDRVKIQQWGWRYPYYTYYWDDPTGGAWIGVNELRTCGGA